MDSPLLARSKQFALDIIKVCNKVKSEKEKVYLQISLSVVVQVSVRTSEKHFMVMEKMNLLLNFKSL